MGGYGLKGAAPWWVAVAVVLGDQLTKIWAVASLDDGPIRLLGDTLAFRLTRNPGAAFSSFTSGGTALGVVAIIIPLVVSFALPRMKRRVDQIALALVLGGAIGNLIDRIFRGDGFLDGAVVDFIDFSFWPTFNVADSGISVGVVLMLLAAVVFKPPHEDDARDKMSGELERESLNDG